MQEFHLFLVFELEIMALFPTLIFSYENDAVKVETIYWLYKVIFSCFGVIHFKARLVLY